MTTPTDNDRREDAARLLRDIFDTNEDTLMGEDVLLQQLIDATKEPLSDSALEQRFPELWQHFRFDEEAMETYRMVVELVEAEKADELTQPAIMPQMPSLLNQKNRPSITERINSALDQFNDAIRIEFPGFVWAFDTNLRGIDLIEEPVEIQIHDSPLALIVDLYQNDEIPDRLNLLIEIQTDDTELLARLESQRLILQSEHLDDIKLQATVKNGEAIFEEVQIGRYRLIVSIDQQPIEIVGIDLSHTD